MFGGTTNVNVHLANADALHQIQTSLDSISKTVSQPAWAAWIETILKNQVKMMADASKLQSDIDAIAANVATAVTAIGNLEAQIAALSAGQVTQEQIDAMDAEVSAAKDALVAATPTP